MSREKDHCHDQCECHERRHAVRKRDGYALFYTYDEAIPYKDDEYDPKYGNNPESCRLRSARMLPSASLIPLATAYVRPQTYGNIYTPCYSLARGTCFPELSKPYVYEEEKCNE